MVAALSLIQGPAIVSALASQQPQPRASGYDEGLASGRRILNSKVRGSWGTPPADVLNEEIREWSESNEDDDRANEYATEYVRGLKAAMAEAEDAP